MSDLIRRDDVLEAFNRLCGICGKKNENNGAMCRACSLDDAIDIVEDTPTAEPKVGKWKPFKWYFNAHHDSWTDEVKCSECGKMGDDDFNFCPYCGSYNGGKNE